VKFDHPLLLRVRAVFLTVLFLVAVGVFTRPVEDVAWERVKSGQTELNLASIEGALGQGIIVGILGGFRAITADFLWIQANAVWERKERATFDSMVRLLTTIDPRPLFFWINSARMIAYDIPSWRIREEGGYDTVPDWRQREIDLEQAEQAFALIERGLRFHPQNSRLYLEIGQIYLNRLDDVEAAAPWFLKASQQPDAPHFAARIYAELLRRQGKNAAAYTFLKDLHKRLPDGDLFARKGIILERIRTLEETLKIPVEDRFKPY